MIRIVPLMLLACCAGCASHRPTGPFAEVEASFERARNRIGRWTDEAASIHLVEAPDPDPEWNWFEDAPAWFKAVDLGSEHVSRLSGEERIALRETLHSGTMPDHTTGCWEPRHAIVFILPRGARRQLLICFWCEKFDAGDSGGTIPPEWLHEWRSLFLEHGFRHGLEREKSDAGPVGEKR